MMGRIAKGSEVPRSNAARATSPCVYWVFSAPRLRVRIAILYAVRRGFITPHAHGAPQVRLMPATLRSSPFPTPSQLRFAPGSPVSPGWQVCGEGFRRSGAVSKFTGDAEVTPHEGDHVDDLRFSPIPIHAKRTATEPLVRDLNFDLKRPQKEHGGGAPRPDSTGGAA